MTDSSTHNCNKIPNGKGKDSPDQDGFSKLCSLSPDFEQSELDNLHRRLNNTSIQADDVSRVLPEAIILRSRQDKQLTEAMVPTVEEAIETSVKQNPAVISNAIFPIIGPATRKAIATFLEATLQSINHSLEYSLSPKSFKWRLEALQTGKSFAEVALVRALVYRVEQVFLIHKHTGIVLQHVVAEAVAAQDADLVSAMLTAIQDFVHDSFSMQAGDALETLQFGDLTIWIEQGPQAVLASVIRGHPPKELKLVSRDTIEKIHLKFISVLNSFQGDTEPFQAARPYLEACLQAQYKAKKEEHYPYVWASLSAVAIALGVWSFLAMRESQRWTTYVEKLQAEHGIVITSIQQQPGKYMISGLRDPLATDPIELLKTAHLNRNKVISHWEPYLSLDSEFVLKRAKQSLQPPKTVLLKIDENGILHATGSAPQQWIVDTRKLVQVIPGINRFQEDNLVAEDRSQIEISKKQIEKQMLFFQQGNTQLIPNQDKTLQTVLQEINKLSDTARVFNKDVRLLIVGHTDGTGTEQINIGLSQDRALTIRFNLISNGLKNVNLSSVGVGMREPLRDELTEQDRAFNRRVSFKVILTDAPKRGVANR